MFSHERLKVYSKMLVSVAQLTRLAARWDKRHAVVDHLLRASESMVVNLAEAARLTSVAQRQHVLDYAIGSALECAACLDIAVVKLFLLTEAATGEKRVLHEIVCMLMGLRKSWGDMALQEASPPYGSPTACLFLHECLDVYQVSLDLMRWFHALPSGAKLANRVYRQVDKAITSIILNIAEGNGRQPEADRRSFFDTAEASVVKAAAYVDLCRHKAELNLGHRQSGIELLRRIALMLRGLSAT